MKILTIQMDEKACDELQTWARYYRSNITEQKQVNAIRRARKALCKALKIVYDIKDEVI